jgi:hypothetical protein
LRYSATRQKVTGSIPDDVIGFLYKPNLSSYPVPQRWTKPVTEMSNRKIPGGLRAAGE